MAGRLAGRRAGRRERAGLREAAGQALVETAISLSFLLLLVLGLLQLVMLASTKHVTNYAAFAGGRAALYGTSNDWRNPGQDRRAARAVLDMFDMGTFETITSWGGTFSVRQGAPYALPLLPFSGHLVMIDSRVPYAEQPYIREVGDNASR